MVNLPITSVMELRGHRMAIAACFAFQREISSSVLRDFSTASVISVEFGISATCPLSGQSRNCGVYAKGAVSARSRRRP
jgi:hypothetical protein